MKYSLFLFDLDDTLLDFRGCERVALKNALIKLKIEDKYEAFYPAYREASSDLWSRFERNEITQEFLKIERFRRGFEAISLKMDPGKANRIYIQELSQTVAEIEGAEELCQSIYGQAEIGIITNGLIEVQQRRLSISKIAPYISFMAVSEKCGYAKPDARFFEYAVKMARKPVAKDKILMVGDRGDADILGAQNFGIDSIYFNPHGRPLGPDIHAKFEIRSLINLLPLIRS
jgi:2-haloacid dehalogenase